MPVVVFKQIVDCNQVIPFCTRISETKFCLFLGCELSYRSRIVFFFYQKKSVTNEHVEIKPELIGKDCQNIDSVYLFDGAARLVSWEQGTPRSLVARRPTSRPSFLKTSVYCVEW